MSKIKLEEIANLGLAKIAKLEKKPPKPTKPTTLEKSKVERTTYWKSTAAGKDFDLINDILKKVPKDVDPSDIRMWIEAKFLGGSGQSQKETHFGIVREVPNPKYVEAMDKYKRELISYDVRVSEWEKKKTEHDSRLELRTKYNELIKVSSTKSALKDKLSKISQKITVAGF